MTSPWSPKIVLFALAAIPLACNGSSQESSSESNSGGESSSSSESTSESTSHGSASDSESTGQGPTSGDSNSASGTTIGTTGVSDSQGSDATSATDPTAATESSTGDSGTSMPLTTGITDSTTMGGTDSTGGTGGTDPTTTGSTGDASTGEMSTGCVPSEEICNDIDDDCNGLIDDVDEAMDGICDCLNIVIMGKKGANPSSEFETWLEDQGTKVDRIHTTPNESLSKETIAAYDIVILDWLQRSYTAQEAEVIEDFVRTGGGMMSLTGFTNSQANANVTNSLISSIGLNYNTSKGWFSGPVTNFIPHPITMGLNSVSFFGGLFINIIDDGVGVNETIMTLPQGPVGVVQEREEGRAFVFGDEWVEFDSQWQNQPEIKLFWVQTLQWIGPQDSCILPQ